MALSRNEELALIRASTDVDFKEMHERLVVYVSPDDVCLSREQFLRIVVSRIEDDLMHETFVGGSNA